MARLLLRTNVDTIRPGEDLPRLPIPLLFIFGGQDDTVPRQHFDAMAAARPDAETWLVEEAGHARIYNTWPAEYVDRVSRFPTQALR